MQVQKEAIQAVEQDGMVFIDEIDKIVSSTDSRFGMLLYLGLVCVQPECEAFLESIHD